MRAFEVATAQPWLVREEYLRTILEIAARENTITPEVIDKIDARREALAMRRGHAPDKTRYTEKRGEVAVINIAGPIVRYADFFSDISGGVSTQHLALDFRAVMDDPTVKAIVLNIDSPGGEATGIHELGEAIHDSRGKGKPIVAYVEGYGASAAYWIASATDRIIADKTAMVGSIGVVFAVPDPTKRTARDIEIVSAQSPKKRLDPTTEVGRSELQRWADELGSIFVSTVARNRGVTEDVVMSDFGQGGIRIGDDARAYGMIDEIGSLEALVAELQTPNGRSRVATAQKTTNTRRTSMSENSNPAPAAEPIPTSVAADNVAELAALRKENEELKAKSLASEKAREAAELERKKVEANAVVDRWLAEGRVTGNGEAKARAFYVALATGQSVTPEGFAEVVAAMPQISTERIAKDVDPKAKEVSEKPTADDFRAFDRGDRAAKDKVHAFVSGLVASDKSKNYVAHLKTVRSEALAAGK